MIIVQRWEWEGSSFTFRISKIILSKEAHINNSTRCPHLQIAHTYSIHLNNSFISGKTLRGVIFHQLQCLSTRVFKKITLIIRWIIQIWYIVLVYNSSKIIRYNLNWIIQCNYMIILEQEHSLSLGSNLWITNMKMAADNMIIITKPSLREFWMVAENKTVWGQWLEITKTN